MGIHLVPMQDDVHIPDTADAQLREAKSRLDKNDSYEARTALVSTAINKEFGTMNGYANDGMSAYPECMFDNAVIFRKGGKLFRVSYDITNGDVTFGDDLVEVAPTYTTLSTPVREANTMMKCPECGAMNSDNKGACSKCGAKMPKAMDDMKEANSASTNRLPKGSGAKAPLGSGGRSAALRAKGLSNRLIAYIGRKKWGSARMAKWSAGARKRKSKAKD